MPRERRVPMVVSMMTHDQGMKDCVSATSSAIHTVEVPGAGWFAALVLNQAECPFGYVVMLDRDELEGTIALLQNAMEDAERAERGEPMLHAAPVLTRQ